MQPLPFLTRAGLVCGIIAPLWWGAMIVYCASQFAGYHHASHFISELAARDSPTQDLMRNAGFIFTGALYVVFAGSVAWQLRATRLALVGASLIALAGLARIGAGVYACEPGCDPTALSSAQDWHYRYASAGYYLMMMAAVVIGVTGNRHAGLKHLLAWGIGTVMWCAVFLVFMQTNFAWQGGFQRLASGVLSLWVLVFAISLWRASQPLLPAPVGTNTTDTPPARRKSRRRRR